MQLHPIPVGGKALLDQKRFTVNKLQKLGGGWEYDVTFDDDSTKTTVQSQDVEELTHPDAERKYRFLFSEVHPYQKGDLVKFLSEDGVWRVGTIVEASKTAYACDRKYCYRVKSKNPDDEGTALIYNTEKCLSPVNYSLSASEWEHGDYLRYKKKYPNSESKGPKVEDVPFFYNVDVSLFLLAIILCQLLTCICAARDWKPSS